MEIKKRFKTVFIPNWFTVDLKTGVSFIRCLKQYLKRWQATRINLFVVCLFVIVQLCEHNWYMWWVLLWLIKWWSSNRKSIDWFSDADNSFGRIRLFPSLGVCQWRGSRPTWWRYQVSVRISDPVHKISFIISFKYFSRNFNFGLNSLLVNLGSLVLQALLEHWPQTHAKGFVCRNFAFEIVVIIYNQ